VTLTEITNITVNRELKLLKLKLIKISVNPKKQNLIKCITTIRAVAKTTQLSQVQLPQKNKVQLRQKLIKTQKPMG